MRLEALNMNYGTFRRNYQLSPERYSLTSPKTATIRCWPEFFLTNLYCNTDKTTAYQTWISLHEFSFIRSEREKKKKQEFPTFKVQEFKNSKQMYIFVLQVHKILQNKSKKSEGNQTPVLLVEGETFHKTDV